MLDHVIVVLVGTRTLFKVDTESPVPQQAGIGHTVVDADLPAVGGEHVPRELAAHVEATDVTSQQELLARRQLVPDPEPNERINPVDIPGAAMARPLDKVNPVTSSVVVRARLSATS